MMLDVIYLLVAAGIIICLYMVMTSKSKGDRTVLLVIAIFGVLMILFTTSK